MVGRIRFALERLGLPRHRSHVAQLGSLGHYAHEIYLHIYFAGVAFWLHF